MEQIIIPKNPNDKYYGYLSNDSNHGFIEKLDFSDNHIYWKTVTHYMEAKKFEGTRYEGDVKKARTPLTAKRMAKEKTVTLICDVDNRLELKSEQKYGTKHVGHKVREDWNLLFDDYLKFALNAKFSQHSQIAKLLLETSPRIIKGVDIMGEKSATIIMEIREKLLKNTT